MATAEISGEKDRLPKPGDEIKVDDKKYKLIQVLGDGGYGTVFLSQDGEKRIAVKTEKYSKSMLHIEVNVLKAANAASCKHFTELIDYGSNRPEYVFMMMTLLNKDLHKLRNEMPERKFSLSTALRLGIQSLKAIEELHKIGYLSRDIKPGNFAPGQACNRQNKVVFMYDFGLARRYTDKNNNLIPSRKEVGWRGTTRYGSLNAHLRLDLGRRDDLESWYYMLVEITRGTLPWRLVTDRTAVQAAKTNARNAGRTQFLFETPKQYDAVLCIIDAMQFETTPDYDKIHKHLEEVREEKQIRMHEHWDWELFNHDQHSDELFRQGIAGEERGSREGLVNNLVAVQTSTAWSFMDGLVTQGENDEYPAQTPAPPSNITQTLQNLQPPLVPIGSSAAVAAPPAGHASAAVLGSSPGHASAAVLRQGQIGQVPTGHTSQAILASQIALAALRPPGTQ